MAGKPRFSIITPVYVANKKRQAALKRAIKSVENQTFKDYEYIVINDGSPITPEVPGWVDIIHKQHEERIIGFERGFKKAKGEIFCTLDSDDEYEPNYLEKVGSFFNDWPDFKIFNFGCTFVHKDGAISQRGAFKPERKKVGHEIFGGGNIVSGTFVFHRSVYDDLGGFPQLHIKNKDCSAINYGKKQPRDLFMWTPFDFSAFAQLQYPEIRKYFMVDHVAEPNKIIKELGNPWGQDYYLFYKYTRKYHSKPIDENLYIVHLK